MTLTHEHFTKNLTRLPTSPELWADRKNSLPMDATELLQRKLGELCWVAAVSRLDICARSSRIASRINALFGNDAYPINDRFDLRKDGNM